MNGGRFDFDDGGTYCGGWEEGKAHGHGVCTGPQGKGEYAGAWHYGFEVSGVYTWPSGNTYQGQWQNGKRHGLGVEQRGRWIYKGEWTQGYKGRYGHRQSITSQARYQGTWSAGFHDGYGTETYVDGGAYQGQWLRGMRHGYGVRKSAQHGVAAKYRSQSRTNASLTSLRSEYCEEEENEKKKYDVDESRGGFVLKACSEAPTRRRSLSERSLAVKRTILSGLRIKKQHSTGDIHQRVTSGSLRSSGSTVSCTSDESEHRQGREHLVMSQEEHIDPNTTEVYKGEWKNDKRCGFGIGERSDGLKYEGEWFNNRKCGYGITTFKDGRREEGKYKNNVLVCANRKKGLLFVRSSKLKERVGNAVEGANRAATIAQQKADIAVSRTATAKERSEQADYVALQAREDADTARICAKQLAPEFKQPGTEVIRMHMNRLQQHQHQLLQQQSTNSTTTANHVSFDSPPASKASHESRDLSDEIIILNSPPLPNSTPSTNYSSVQQPQTPGGTHHQPQQPVFNMSSYQQGVITNPGAVYNLTLQQQQSYSSGGYQNSSGFQGSNPAAVYEQQQGVSSSGYAGSQQASVLGPSSYQVMPSVSCFYNPTAGGYQHQPGTSFAATSGTHFPTVQIPFNSFTSSYLPNAVPHHNTSVPHHYQQQQQQQQHRLHHHIVTSHYPSPGTGILDQQTAIFHLDPASLQQSNGTDVQRQFNNDATIPQSTQNNTPASSRSLLQSLNAGQSSSRMSLSDDHYDQYMMSTNPNRAGFLRRNKPSLTRQPFAVHDIAQNVYRRSTLATAGDKRLEDVVGRGGISESGGSEGPGSLPNLDVLEATGVRLRREEAARLASHQRQELQRLLEEEQLLHSNPLRYLFHPAFRAWIIRWKMPLVLSMANLFLLMVFYNLLTYDKRTRERR